MKRNKKLVVLLVVLVVIIAITLVITQIEDKKENIKSEEAIVFNVSPDEVETVSWSLGSTEFTLHKSADASADSSDAPTSGEWVYDADENFPVDDEKISELLSVFENFKSAFTITDVDDPGQYGLDNPEGTITLETADQTYEIKLGDFSKMDEQRYFSIGDGNVYLAETDPYDTFNIELSDIVKNDDAPTFDTVTELTVKGEDSYTATSEELATAAYSENDVYFAKVNGKAVSLDTKLVENYAASVSALDLTNYVTYNAANEDLSQWGLDDPAITVTIKYTDDSDSGSGSGSDGDSDGAEKAFSFSIARDEEKAQEKAAAIEKGEEYTDTVPGYIRIGESSIIYEITEDEYDAIAAVTYNDLRHQDVLVPEFEDVTQIDVTLEGESYTITAAKSGDEITYSLGDETIDISDLQSAVEALTAEEFDADKSKGKEEISMTFHVDSENHPEINVTLYRYDKDYCLAEVDGETFALVARGTAVNVIEAVNGLIL